MLYTARRRGWILPPHPRLEHRAVALNVNRWTPSSGALLLRNFTSTLPGGALQHLGQGQLLRTQTELLADGISYPVSAKIMRSEPLRLIAGEPYSSMMVIARHSMIAGCEGGSLGMPDTGSG